MALELGEELEAAGQGDVHIGLPVTSQVEGPLVGPLEAGEDVAVEGVARRGGAVGPDGKGFLQRAGGRFRVEPSGETMVIKRTGGAKRRDRPEGGARADWGNPASHAAVPPFPSKASTPVREHPRGIGPRCAAHSESAYSHVG